ncbi:TPA: threonylcarbamoyl-AMP synthase [Candidatus Poribacteria bacterium]|nr:threonylcarbamoyl-AMP synthase [Candidatus Poribacteria bacterium]
MKVVKVRSERDIHLAVSQAVETLKSGGIVIFPTDTVYGVGADSYNPKAISRLYEVKGRERSKPIPLLVSSVGQVEEIADSIPEGFYRLVDRFWPGGLTVVLSVKRGRMPDLLNQGGETLGFRMPDHDLTLEMAECLGRPIAATSANPSGEEAVRSFEEFKVEFLERVDLAIDGGECIGGTPSTVIDLTSSPPRLIREGSIPAAQIAECLGIHPETEAEPPKPFTVLFVCTGNICRSAMAEWLLREKLRRRGLEDKIRVFSAGTFALFGNEPSENAKEVMREIGINILEHRSRQLSRWLLRRVDLVLVMARHHRSSVKRLLPQLEGRVFLLSEFAEEGNGDVDDPYGKSIEEYRRCRDQIERYLNSVVEKLAHIVEERGI